MKRGFTVVEIIVVIVVLVVLATIGVIAYGAHQDSTSDTARRAAVSQIEQALAAFRLQKDGDINIGGYSTSAGGMDSNGVCTYSSNSGWVYQTAANHPCTVGAMLMNSGLLPADFFDKLMPNEDYRGSSDPKLASMMIYPCNSVKRSYLLYYYVKNPTIEETSSLSKLRTPGSCPQAVSSLSDSTMDSFGMKAAVEIKL